MILQSKTIIFLLTLLIFATIPVLFLYEVHEYQLNATNAEGFKSNNVKCNIY